MFRDPAKLTLNGPATFVEPATAHPDPNPLKIQFPSSADFACSNRMDQKQPSGTALSADEHRSPVKPLDAVSLRVDHVDVRIFGSRPTVP